MAPNRRLKQARELRGWSQAKIAELIGTDATTVSRWERGLFVPTPFFRERLCGLFGKNAEELGLLEPTQASYQKDSTEVSKDPGSTYTHIESGTSGKTATAGRGEMIALKPRSSSDNIDTFTYILQKSSQEQQAYMLWEHAYVQALHDQRSEARRLGQASVNVFEQPRHPNAAVVRSWLHQQGLLSASSHGTTDTSFDAALPAVIQHKRSSRPLLRVSGAGMLVVLVLVGGLLLSGFISHRPNTSTSANVNYIPQAMQPNNTTVSSHQAAPAIPTQPNPAQQDHATTSMHSSASAEPTQPTSSTLLTPTSTVVNPINHVPAGTTMGTPTITPTSVADPSIIATIAPLHLNPTTCNADGSAYRCTITLAVYANMNENFSWQASSSGIPVKFNSFQGTTSTAKTFQEIVYINTTCSQNGSLSFVFSASSSMQQTSVSVPWGC